MAQDHNPESASGSEQNQDQPVAETIPTFYADEDYGADSAGHSASSSSWDSSTEGDDWGEPQNPVQSFCDSILRRVPFPVLHHLNNSRKELIQAAIALGQSELEKSERWMNRVRKVHKQEPSASEWGEVKENS
jgi:hypothetical protein